MNNEVRVRWMETENFVDYRVTETHDRIPVDSVLAAEVCSFCEMLYSDSDNESDPNDCYTAPCPYVPSAAGAANAFGSSCSTI